MTGSSVHISTKILLVNAPQRLTHDLRHFRIAHSPLVCLLVRLACALRLQILHHLLHIRLDLSRVLPFVSFAQVIYRQAHLLLCIQIRGLLQRL